jgi:hypothetical protein
VPTEVSWIKYFFQEDKVRAELLKDEIEEGHFLEKRIELSSQEAYPVDSGLSRCSMLSDRIGAVARTDLLGLATKHSLQTRPPAHLLHIDQPESTG